jgi:hypothetical protein
MPFKCAIDENTKIGQVPKDTNKIHLVRPVKKELLDDLLNNRPVQEITLSESCYKRMPKKAIDKIKEKNIKLLTEKRRGRALNVSMDTMLEIIELRKDYQSIREIEKVTGVPKSTIHYLLKYADRGKIKKGNTVIYLK